MNGIPRYFNIGCVLFCVLVSLVGLACGQTAEDAIWAAQTPEEVAKCTEQIQAERAAQNKPSFPYNHDQFHASYSVIPTDPKTNVGGYRLDMNNWSGKPVKLDMAGVLLDHWGKTIETFSESVELPEGKSQTKEFQFPVESAKRYRLIVTYTDPATKTQREVRFYPLLDSFVGLRKQISLNGTWKELAAEKADFPPAQGEWANVTIPRSIGEGQPKPYLWLSKTFTVPESMKGSRLVIRFDALGYNPAVYLNGQLVHEQKTQDPFTPFEVDVTDQVKFDAENTLMVCVTGPNKMMEDGLERFLQPMGCWPTGMVCYDVSLFARPAVFIADRFVQTSVRDGMLLVTTWVTNSSDAPAEVKLCTTVLDGDKVVKTSPEESVTLAAGETKELTWKEPWKDARLWWPHDPHLYRLRSELVVAENVADRADVRFGFRDIRCEGTKLKLNGKDAWLRRYSEIVRWSNMITPEGTAKLFQMVFGSQHNSFRFHVEPPPDFCLDIADEMGLLTVVEGALWSSADGYAMKSDVFWENVKEHLQGIVKLYRNHPSIIMWSPENEWGYICISGIYPELLPKKYPIMSEAVRAVDTTRPLSYDAEGDAAGSADTRNLHYPQDWDARWPLPNHAWFNYGEKPLILGEFMMSDGMFNLQERQLFGDRSLFPPVCSSVAAYGGGDNHTPTMLQAVRMFCDAYRLGGVVGLNPWFFRSEVTELMPAVVVTARQIPRGFTGGTVRNVPLTVLYDLFEDQKITLQAYVDVPGEQPNVTEKKLDVIGGQRPTVDVEISAPPVEKATAAELVLRVVSENGKMLFENRIPATVFPHRPIAASQTIHLLDPKNRLAPLGTIAGLSRIETIKEFSPLLANMLILAPGAGETLTKYDRDQIEDFVRDGGKVFVMAQGAERKILPVNLALDEGYKHTFAFVRAPSHPVMKRMRDCDFTAWGPENWVVRQGAFLKPRLANSVVLVESGTTGGLVHAPMMEVCLGRGSYILCQLAVAENLDEPAVRQLLQNVFDYAAVPLNDLGPLYVTENTNPNAIALINGLGGETKSFNKTSEAISSGVVLVDGSSQLSADEAERLKQFAQVGGIVWIHRLTPETLPNFSPLVGDIQLKKIESSGTNVGFAVVPAKQLIRAGTPELLDGIGQNELTWDGIAEYVVEGFSPKTPQEGRRLTVPAGLVVLNQGKGRVLIDQIRWDTNSQFPICTWLTNLGVRLDAKQAYFPEKLYHPVDLSALSQSTLSEIRDELKDLLATPTDPRVAQYDASMIVRKEFGGVPFILGSVACKAKTPVEINLDGLRAQKIAFLMAAGKGGVPDKPVGRVTLEYTDGTRVELPIVTNQQIGPMGSDSSNPDVQPVWRSPELKARMYLYEWSQPHPEKQIQRIKLEGCLVVTGITPITEVMRTTMSPAEATFMQDGVRKEGGALITFHPADQILWNLDFITPGTYWITLQVRTGGGSATDMIGGYHLLLNGKELPLIDPLVPIQLGAMASDASWKVWNGVIRTKVPVPLKVGDKLKLITKIDWSQANQLSLGMLTRVEESRKRDAENKSDPTVHGLILDRE